MLLCQCMASSQRVRTGRKCDRGIGRYLALYVGILGLDLCKKNEQTSWRDSRAGDLQPRFQSVFAAAPTRRGAVVGGADPPAGSAVTAIAASESGASA